MPITEPEKRDEIGTRISRLSELRSELVVARSGLQSELQALLAATKEIASDRTQLSLKRRDLPDWPSRADILKSHDRIEELRSEAGAICASTRILAVWSEFVCFPVQPEFVCLCGG